MAAFLNVYEAVRTLRPNWVERRGAEAGRQPAVYLNGVLTPGGIGVLSGVDPDLVLEVCYLSTLEANVRFGSSNGSGAILIKTRHGPAIACR
jgi:hypothetical protein